MESDEFEVVVVVWLLGMVGNAFEEVVVWSPNENLGADDAGAAANGFIDD